MKYHSLGINKNTIDILVSDKDNLPEEEYGTQTNTNILVAMDIYTQKLGIEFNNVRYNEKIGKHEYILPNGDIIFFNLLSEQLEDPPHELICELESEKRKGGCHLRSIEVLFAVKNGIIHTGMITLGNQKILHSVVEAKGDIIDWTRNIIIDKNNYVKIFDFNILSSIKAENISYDSKFIEQVDVGLKIYLTFRDELMRDINRNQFLFEQDEKSKIKLKNIN